MPLVLQNQRSKSYSGTNDDRRRHAHLRPDRVRDVASRRQVEPAMIPSRSFRDEPGRAEKAALKRVEASTAAAWYVNPYSRIPYRLQLMLIRLWLAVRSLFV